MTQPSNPKSPNTPGNKSEPLTYRDAGVDIDAGNALVDAIKPLVTTTTRPGSVGSIGGFGGLFDLKKAGYRDPILVAANDGVGTKLKIAIESGCHDTIGIDLVAMCVNDLIVQGAEPLFFLDYLATGALDVETARDVIAGIAEGCRQSNCALIGGETAEMPGMYHGSDYDLAGFCVGAAERGALLPREDCEAGDILIGLSASGIHSNGYSLVRKLVENSGLSWTDSAPWQPDTTVAKALLEPTRIYVKPVLAKLNKHTAAPGPASPIKALAHITGGGLTENLPRVLPADINAHIDLAAWTPPPVFSWIAQTSGLDDDEMLRTFNCGIGMIIVATKVDAPSVIETLREQGETPAIIGKLTAANTSGTQTQDAPAASVHYANKLRLSA